MNPLEELLALRHAPRRLERYAEQITRLGERLLSLEARWTEAQQSAERDARATHLRLQERATMARVLLERLPPGEAAPAPHATRPTLEELYVQLQSRAPAAFAMWRPLLDVNAKAYMGFPAHSCSVPGHPMAEAFARFLTPYLRGPILDIGCGPQPVPQYLAGVPAAEIAGVDPLDAPHPFTFVHGIAEHLPWDGGSFHTVVCATSLDHVLLLDDALAEIHRVLKPGGRFLTWVAFSAGAKPYRPLTEPVRLDEFHLFHFDRPWFLQAMGRHFEVEEEIDFGKGQESRFFSLRKARA